MKTCTCLLFLLTLLLPSGRLLAGEQVPLHQHRETSRLTYIYRISDQQARQIHRKGFGKVDASFLQELFLDYPTDSLPPALIEPGHYLKTYAHGGQQIYELHTVSPITVKILNNNSDLCVQVFDEEGRLLDKVRVKTGLKKLRFDEDLQCYIDKKSNQKGLLSVEYLGRSYFYALDRQWNNPTIRRLGSQILTAPVLSAVGRPISYLLNLPVDGVKSLIYKHPYGSINRTRNFFVRSFHRLAYGEEIGPKPVYGYLMLNQPKYAPGDTLRFKSFLIKKGKPLTHDSLELVLHKQGKTSPLGYIQAYRPGGFEDALVLHDSLQLQLDRSYQLSLRTSDYVTLITSNFIFEEYELSGTKLSVFAPTRKHYRGLPFKLMVSGTDENGLNIQNGTLEVRLRALQTDTCFTQDCFTPTELFYHKEKLAPLGATHITLPDSVFPPARLTYSAEISLHEPGFQSHRESLDIEFFHQNQDILIEVDKDSLRIDFLENGLPQVRSVQLWASDSEGREQDIATRLTPFRLPLDPLMATYTAQHGPLQSELDLVQIDDGLSGEGRRSADSVFVSIDNPRRLPLSYQLYTLNKEIARGRGTDIQLALPLRGKHDCTLSLRYIWGGQAKENQLHIPYEPKRLQVSLQQPELVFPGQEVELGITVNDHNGRPVANADLTAMALTSKFDYNTPSPHLPPENKKQRRFINHFSAEAATQRKGSGLLDQEWWQQKAGIDSLPYFQFLFPGKDLFRYEYPASSGIRQMAIFVAEKGRMLPVQILYIDNIPVYFSWSTNLRPYSFRVSAGRHHIKIRTREHLYTLEIKVSDGAMKTIVSFDPETYEGPLQKQKMPTQLSKEEKLELFPYILSYKQPDSQNLAWLQNYRDIHLLQAAASKYAPQWAGPIKGQVSYFEKTGDTLSFWHEGGYRYHFEEQKLKMEALPLKDYRTPLWNRRWTSSALKEEVYTPYTIETLWENMLEERIRKQWIKPTTNYHAEYGRLQIQLKGQTKTSQKALTTLLLDPQNRYDVQILGGEHLIFENLQEAYYQLLWLYRDGSYRRFDSLRVKKGGTTTLNRNLPPLCAADSFSLHTLQNLKEKALHPHMSSRLNEADLRTSLHRNFENQLGNNQGAFVSGVVNDAADGNPIPGVTVLVKNTEMGTITDLNGHFSLTLPLGYNTLSFQFVGYDTREIQLGIDGHLDVGLSPLNVHLHASQLALDEVVVVGYGVSKKGMLTAAAAGIYASDQGPQSNTPQLKRHAGKDQQAAEDQYKGAHFDPKFLATLALADSLRHNFADAAYWAPRLRTDENGSVHFKVCYPHDITSWQNHVVALTDKGSYGTTQQLVKAYKPWMARLALPQFLVLGDSIQVYGHSTNFLPQAEEVSRWFVVQNQAKTRKVDLLKDALVDSLWLRAQGDSLHLEYHLQKFDGYRDGERRSLPVLQQGLEHTEGQLYLLRGDTLMTCPASSDSAAIILSAHSQPLSLLIEELEKVTRQKFSSNDQLASRLKAHLLLLQVEADHEKHTVHHQSIRSLIRDLQKNSNQQGLWGWWPRQKYNAWVSLHVLEALHMAQSAHFDIQLNPEVLAAELRNLLLKKEYRKDYYYLLKSLHLLNQALSAASFIEDHQTHNEHGLQSVLEQIELCQLFDLPCDTPALLPFEQRSLTGSRFYSAPQKFGHPLVNDPAYSLMAYRIWSRQSQPDTLRMEQIQQYFWEEFAQNKWHNNLLLTNMASALLPQLLQETAGYNPPILHFSGPIDTTLNSFPTTLHLTAEKPLQINKTGVGTILLSMHQNRWEAKPPLRREHFQVKTWFDTPDQKLHSGRPQRLYLQLELSQKADFVRLVLPLPAGCSYSNKAQQSAYEVHREHFDHAVVIYCDQLMPGSYTFYVDLQARFPGTFNLNPAYAELMYFPVIRGNNESKKTVIH